MSKNTIIKGTLILTFAGFITRIIGFFYRIFLSNTLGAENLGVYQLVFPIYSLCFTLYASGIQTSISRLVAAEYGRGNFKNMKKILRVGLFFSVSIALTLSILLFRNADFIAQTIILEERCANSLRVLSIVFPFCGITACINGYYYGLKKAGVPASTQLFEQIVRVVSVYVIAVVWGKGDVAVTCELAVFGILLGEIGSNLYSIVSMMFENRTHRRMPKELPVSQKNKITLRDLFRLRTQIGGMNRLTKRSIAASLLKVSLPLTGNRLLISILQSFEAILIPNMLKKFGLSTSEALSVYGILIGMSLPFIMFPSTITNSLAVLLLPTVAEAQATSNNRLIDNTASVSIKYSLVIGIFSTGVFIIFGSSLGVMVFNNAKSGEFLLILAWLCPFLYLTTTLSSIINGLGKTHITLFNTIAGLAIRILFILFLVPEKGISGYLFGLLASQLAMSALDVLAIFRNIPIQFNAVDWILKPAICMLFSGFFVKHFYEYALSMAAAPNLFLLIGVCIVLCFIYITLLFISRAVTMEEFGR